MKEPVSAHAAALARSLSGLSQAQIAIIEREMWRIIIANTGDAHSVANCAKSLGLSQSKLDGLMSAIDEYFLALRDAALNDVLIAVQEAGEMVQPSHQEEGSVSQ
jgi:hypothetical protein